jgi:hypothetical protein
MTEEEGGEGLPENDGNGVGETERPPCSMRRSSTPNQAGARSASRLSWAGATHLTVAFGLDLSLSAAQYRLLATHTYMSMSLCNSSALQGILLLRRVHKQLTNDAADEEGSRRFLADDAIDMPPVRPVSRLSSLVGCTL